MTKILDRLKNKTFLLILITFVLCLFIYFCFPYVMIAQFSPFENTPIRLFFIFVAIGGSVFYYYKKIHIKQTTSSLINEETEGKNNLLNSKKIAAEFQSKIEENLKIVKSSYNQKKNKLDELPLYLVLGPNNSGKTSTIFNSKVLVSLGNKFSNTTQKPTESAKFCEWWYSNDAVFIDTEGEFLNPSYEENWEYLLQSLQKARPQKPLNGIIVCFSLADLVQQEEQVYINQALKLKKRLLETSASFGLKDLPVYILFTKTDLLIGFHEYFHNMEKSKRDQILGFSFLKDHKNPLESRLDTFKKEYDNLGNSLRQISYGLLQSEQNENNRGFILEFPEQLMALKDKIYSFLSEVFVKNRFEDVSFLRGVYFTSAGSIGLPMDPLGKDSEFSYPFNPASLIRKPFDEQSGSFFIKQLFTDVILPDKGISALSHVFKKRIWFTRKFIILFYVSFIFILCGFWTISYFQNKSYLFSLDDALGQYSPKHYTQFLNANLPLNESNSLTLLQGLQELSGIPGGYDDKLTNDSMNFPLKGVGLYQGDKINTLSQNIYFSALSQYFVPFLKNILEGQLSNHTDNLPQLYSTLQVYLMLDSSKYFDADVITEWFQSYWKATFLNDKNSKYLLGQLNKNLNVVLQENLFQASLNKNLVQQSQVLLRQLPDEVFLFENIKHAHLSFIPDFKLSAAQEKKAQVAFERSAEEPLNLAISSNFTKLGYVNFFYTERSKYFGNKAFERKDWILGIDNNGLSKPAQFVHHSTELYNKVKKLYLEEYLNRWNHYTNTITIKKMVNLQDAINATGVLASPDSPVKTILSAVRNNTILSPSLGSVAKKGNSFFKDKLESISDENPVDNAFTNLNNLTAKKEGEDKKPLDDILETFAQIHGVFLNLQQDKSGAVAALPKDLETKMLTLAGQTPTPVSNWLTSLASYAGSVSTAQIVANINAQWQQILPQCLKVVQNKYPFCAHCTNSVTQSDFSSFFGYEGALDNFLKANFAQFANTNVYPWQWKKDLTKYFTNIHQLEAATRIRNDLFQAGSQNLQMNFSVKPTYLDSKVLTEEFSSNGQSFTYAHGPQRPVPFTWPNSSTQNTSLVFHFENNSEPLEENFSELWSIFQFTEKNHIQTDPESGVPSMNVTLSGKKSSFEIYPTQGGNNPFAKPRLFDFQCPNPI